jgi:CBS domain-containing protein
MAHVGSITSTAHRAKGFVMSTVNEILAAKGNHLQSVGPHATVLDAALLMNEQKIGCLVVMEGGNVVGMFSERDILKRVVGSDAIRQLRRLPRS